MNEPQELRVRTLQGYGLNGIMVTFPNGTTMCLKHDIQGVPDILIEGDAKVTRLRDTSVRVLGT